MSKRRWRINDGDEIKKENRRDREFLFFIIWRETLDNFSLFLSGVARLISRFVLLLFFLLHQKNIKKVLLFLFWWCWLRQRVKKRERERNKKIESGEIKAWLIFFFFFFFFINHIYNFSFYFDYSISSKLSFS